MIGLMDFYKLLCEKGYKNVEIDDFLLEVGQEYSLDAIARHVKVILEIDRIDVFKKWYGATQIPESGIFIWEDRFDASFRELKEFHIDYQVDYILQNTENPVNIKE